MLVRVGHYYIVPYDESKIKKWKAAARHVYSVKEIQGEKYIYDLNTNSVPEKVMVTDKFVPLTSSYDMMSWEIFKSMLFYKAKFILNV